MSSKKRRFLILSIFILLLLTIVAIKSTGDKSPVDSSHAYFEDERFGEDNENVSLVYITDGARNHWSCPTSVSTYEELKLIRNPYRFGFEFKGWYLDKNFNYPLTDLPYLSHKWKVITLYAKWEQVIRNNYNVQNYSYLASRRIKNQTIRLKDTDYSFVENLRIPGMPSTKNDEFLNQFIFSEDQYPQGICLTNDYYLISSYSETEECMGEILVFDRLSGELLVTLGMDADSHLGGIAFDGKNLWVCNSSKKALERISYDFVQLMAQSNKGEVVDCRDMVDTLKVENTPSCITYYSGRLWIASHRKVFESKVVSYYYNSEKNKLKSLSSFRIPAQVQGLAFDKMGRVYLSTSFGRTSSSYLKIYKSTMSMSDKPDKPMMQIEMPPCSEEIHCERGNVYLLFESAGEKYYAGTDGKGNSICPLDKVLVIKTDSLFME